MIKKVLVILLLSVGSLNAQELTTIKGTIKNFSDGLISLTIYPNWEVNPVEHYISIDSSGRFEFETNLTAYNYIDLNIGKIGYLFWMIKGGDDVYLLLDYNDPIGSFYTSGTGGSKFLFMHDYFVNYEHGLDADLKVKNNYNQSLPAFVSYVDSLSQSKLKFLESKRKTILDEFFLLKKADIIGKRNRQIVEYAQSNNLAPADVKKNLEFFSVSPERQALSFEFNDFFDEWIDLNKQFQEFEALSLVDELNFIRVLFFNGQMERPMAELKMHQRVLRFVENHTYLPEMQKGVDEYYAFVRNDKLKATIKNSIDRKKRFFDGFMLPVVSFIKQDGKELKNKELEKKNTLLYIYEDDCIICEDDFDYFNLVASNFDKKDKFQFYTIPLKGKSDLFFEAKTNAELRPSNEDQIKTTFAFKESPGIYLIDTEGKVFGDLPEPALDEGRSLIKAIRDHIPKKD
ncbi:hypothetical protein SAMN06298216_4348 [Spirosomataceae bacterium TFI 002]|nr:hypothetical protein SAMN06298216_4348 [Spirosomataceae bacterium TFI 002]